MKEKVQTSRLNLKPGSRTIDYRAELNPAQYEAVTTLDGLILVIAGAGSGKTRTLVYRVAYLVDQGVPPESILLLTFTRKAAGEMLARAEALVGGCTRVSGGTFHSLAHELLRRWAGRLGWPANFGVIDRGDMEAILSELRQQAGLGEKDRKFPKRRTVAEIISKAANKGEKVEKIMVRDYVHLLGYHDDIKTLAEHYAAYKKTNFLLDFDDLLLELVRLLKEDEEARTKIASNYQYIMVDEYQDTNPVQAEIIGLLGRDHGNVMVVGDDAQSIYSFRGASFRNIMEFPRLFPSVKIIRLEENYRSRQPILDLTNYLISKAREKYEKRLFTRRGGGRRPRLLVMGTEKEQSLFICRRVRELTAQGVPPERIAVLFRASSHSFDLEIELVRHDIDYVKYGGRRFLESAHIKDLLSLLRAAATPGDGFSLTRSLLLLEGIGPKKAAEISAWVEGRRERLQSLQEYGGPAKVRETLAPLADLFAQIGAKGVGLQDRVSAAWEFYRPILETKYHDDYPKRLADVTEFLRLAGNYSSLVRFLTDMTLEPPNTSASKDGPVEPRGRLVLSTVHSAKGLEWKTVFIIWAADGRFPPLYALNHLEDLDEERRLMYVAATRAEDDLYLICPLEAKGGMPTAWPRLSRFLEDIPPELVAVHEDEAQTENSRRLARPPGPPPPPPPDGFTPGQRVSHPVFGLGRVLTQLGPTKIKVDFDHFGAKTLHLDYAGLKKA